MTVTTFYVRFGCFVEHHVLRIETKQAPKPSQPEVVLSDGKYEKTTTNTILVGDRSIALLFYVWNVYVLCFACWLEQNLLFYILLNLSSESGVSGVWISKERATSE